MSQSASQTPAKILHMSEAQAIACGINGPDVRAVRRETIRRRSSLSYEEFTREYRDPRIPVIITDAIKDWQAVSKWSPEYFQQHYYSTKVTVEGRYSTRDQPQRCLGEMIDAILKSSPSAPAPYLRNQNLIDLHPELRADMLPIPIYAFPNWLDGPFSRKLDSRFHRGEPELQISGAGAAFPSMHYDYGLIHSFLAQIYGQKRVQVLSPSQSQCIYPLTGENHHGSSIPDIDHVDLDRFPLFAHASLEIADLEPGDTLFVPAGWWHTTRSWSTSITASFNFANACNWSDIIKECGHLVPFFPKLRFQTYLILLKVFRLALGR
jgi:histone arginine demethylase JMJD6